MTEETLNPRPWTVLVVDDEADVRQYLKTILERSIPGLKTFLAENGRRGLEELARHQVDLILSDHRMPEMEGTEFLQQAARMQPEVPRVLLTGFADVDVATRAVNAGHISAFLQKPAKTDELVGEVRGLLEKRHEQLQRSRAFARTIDSVRRSTEARAPKGGTP